MVIQISPNVNSLNQRMWALCDPALSAMSQPWPGVFNAGCSS
jgi:hypothetical protein